MTDELKEIQGLINKYKEEHPEESIGELSDTYHTFDELYKHRCLLTALAFNQSHYSWKALKHDDGTMYDGMFITGMLLPKGMITYHYDIEYWDLFKVPVLIHAPKHDGHTPNDVLDRITGYIEMSNGKNIPSVSLLWLDTEYRHIIEPLLKTPNDN